MSVLLQYASSNFSWDYFMNMRDFVLPASLFSLLATTSCASSYHDNAGVLRYVNPKIGTYGVTPNGNGGMIPSVSPPFGMTRWVSLFDIISELSETLADYTQQFL